MVLLYFNFSLGASSGYTYTFTFGKGTASKPEILPDMKDDDSDTRVSLDTYVYKVLMILNIEIKFKDMILTRNSTLLYMTMEIKKIIITMK